MRRWRVEGANRETGGAEVSFVNAETEREARDWAAAAGIFVSNVVDAGPVAPPARPAPMPRPAPPAPVEAHVAASSQGNIIMGVAGGIILAIVLIFGFFVLLCVGLPMLGRASQNAQQNQQGLP